MTRPDSRRFRTALLSSMTGLGAIYATAPLLPPVHHETDPAPTIRSEVPR